jgi:hypothetical protein
MNSSPPIRLQLGSPEQREKLVALQSAFAQVCNALAPIVQQNRCWNRVTLHHLAYHQLREQFPALGSQMVCNAIYAVCRSARIVFQHPASPLHISKIAGTPLPRLEFLETSPVYFDRHTLSIRAGELSMYTLDGRMKFQVPLSQADEQRFHDEKLREVILARNHGGVFELSFWFAGAQEKTTRAQAIAAASAQAGLIPDYIKVQAHL